MISQRQVERKYKKLLSEVKTKKFYQINLTNRVNCYECDSCGHVTKTKDVDAGVTPMFYNCEKCGETAVSSFYNDIAPEQKPTVEWYRPTLKYLQKNRKKEEVLDHVFNGGLLDRRIEVKSNG